MIRQLRSLAAAVFAASLALTGCSVGGASVEEPATVSLEGPAVRVVDPGTGDRQELRYSLSDDIQQAATLTVTQGFAQTAPGQDSAPEDNTMTLPLTATIDDEQRHYELGKPSGSVSELQSDIETAEGFIVTVPADSQGRAVESDFAAPTKASETARASVERALLLVLQTPVIFPDEPVGVGAKWTVENRVDGGTPVLQKLTYTLAGRDGDKLDLDVAVEQTPSQQALDFGADEGAATPGQLKVQSTKTQVQLGTLSVDLSQPLPTSGALDYVTTIKYGADKSDTAVEQHTHRAIRWG